MTKISVVVTSFNHANYINRCLNSVVSQVGEFVLEIIIGDDSSTDNTRYIIQGYEQICPEIIRLLPQEPNMGVTKNLRRCLQACSGDYVAICEGDDYWTDDKKLQRQVDFLQNNKECSMCFSAITLYYEDTQTYMPHNDQAQLSKDFLTVDELIERNYIGNFSSCMYRSDVIRRLPAGIYDLYTVDWFFNICCGQFGKIGFIKEPMSVYRLHTRGSWSGKGQLEQMEELKQNIDIYNEFLNFKHDVAFSSLKRGVEDEINRLRILPNNGPIQNPLVTPDKKDSKSKFLPFFRKVS